MKAGKWKECKEGNKWTVPNIKRDGGDMVAIYGQKYDRGGGESGVSLVHCC